MSEEQTGGAPDGANGEGAKPEPKLIPLEEHVALRTKYKAIKAEHEALKAASDERQKSEMTEAEKLKAELDSLRQEAAGYRAERAKQEALDKALKRAGVGDKFTLEGVPVAKLLSKLTTDPATIEDDVFELVESLKRPAGRTGGAGIREHRNDGHEGQKKPEDYSAAELAKLHAEDPDELKRVLEARRSRVQFSSGLKPLTMMHPASRQSQPQQQQAASVGGGGGGGKKK